jgi:hypothetical protein
MNQTQNQDGYKRRLVQGGKTPSDSLNQRPSQASNRLYTVPPQAAAHCLAAQTIFLIDHLQHCGIVRADLVRNIGRISY